MIYSLLISNYGFNYEFRFPYTVRYFKKFIVPYNCTYDYIQMISDIILNEPSISGFSYEYQEYLYLLSVVSKQMLNTNCAIFHGVSFLLNKKGYIITAPSRTGKSTQFKNLRKLYGDSIQILNGDKPVLNFMDDQAIFIEPSPWKGKEGWASGQHGTLNGIVFLKQAKVNKIHLLDPIEAITAIMCRFLYVADDVDNIKIIGDMTERILLTTPVWLLENLGNFDSSKLLYDTLIAYQEKTDE